MERRVVELGADADERAARAEDVAQQLECRGARLEHLEQALVGVELLHADVAEQAGGAADVELRAALGEHLDERGPERLQELPLPGRQARILEAPPDQSSSRA